MITVSINNHLIYICYIVAEPFLSGKAEAVNAKHLLMNYDLGLYVNK
jgi:hypothetical protein